MQIVHQIAGDGTGCVVPIVLRKGRMYEFDDRSVLLTDCNPDFSDVRFYRDGAELPYYIHSRGNYAVVRDSRLSSGPHFILANGDIIYGNDANGIFVTRDNFETSENVYSSAAKVCFVDSAGNIFASTSFATSSGTHKLIKCAGSDTDYDTWAEVLDMSATSGTGLHTSFCEDAAGNLYFGQYQDANGVKIYKSANGGDTWAPVYTNGALQHVHGLYCDLNVTPNAIYAGLDGTPNTVIKSVDAGANWAVVNNTLPSIAFNQMHAGVGYRLLGGEASVYLGASIYRTTDDSTFTPVLKTQQIMTGMVAVGGAVYAFGGSNGANRYAQVYRSDDDGLTWETVHVEPYSVQTSTSAGLRYSTAAGTPHGESDAQILCGNLGSDFKPVRVLEGGSNYQALVFVRIGDVSASGGAIEIATRKTGGLSSNKAAVFTGYLPSGILFRAKIDEGTGATATDTVNSHVGDITAGTGGWSTTALPNAATLSPNIELLDNSFRFAADGKIVFAATSDDVTLRVTNNCTVLAFISTEEISTTFRYIFGRGVLDTAGTMALYIRSNGTIGFRGGIGANNKSRSTMVVGGSSAFPVGFSDYGTHMVGFQLNDASPPVVKFIYDGMIEDAGQNLSATPIAGVLDWSIGADVGGGTGFLGKINDCMIFNGQLTAAQIKAIWEARTGNSSVAFSVCTTPPTTSAQPCKGHSLPIGVGKITVFDGIASNELIEDVGQID